LLKQLDERWKVSKHDVYSQEFDVFAELDFELKTDLKVSMFFMRDKILFNPFFQALTVLCHRLHKQFAENS
jgi:hypothetical protein